MHIHWYTSLMITFVFSCLPKTTYSQEFSDAGKSVLPIAVNYISFRPAAWEEKTIIEEVNEKRNQGGLMFVYYTNTSDQAVALREWYLNERESGHYRLAGDVAWDRRYTDVVAPGETTVQEICGVSADFQVGKKAGFSIIGSNWQPVSGYDGKLEPEKWRISSITFDSTLSNVCIHIRSLCAQSVKISSVSILKNQTKELSLSSSVLEANGHVIARLSLEKALTPGELTIVKADILQEGNNYTFYSHRNAYADFVPNGTWGIENKQYEDAQRHHLNTMVRGGNTADDFFSEDYYKTGFRTMTHTGLYPNVDMIRDLEKHPSVACWYIHDEPDWLYTPQLVLTSHEITKRYSVRKPTMITLCRNVKFFEYGFIPDIPCHDHYSVTAPSSSKWPYPYGTRLEETGYYTADLKYASEPKPIWVWTQGVHLWDQRPKMPLPTPDELGAQLYFNLGRGAKGNLWFTFIEEAGDRYPATKKALQTYSRVVRLLEKDLLLSDPWHGTVKTDAPVDVACLLTPDKAIIFITNREYMIQDSAYQWKDYKNVKLSVSLPSWFQPSDGFELNPEKGIHTVQWLRNNTFVDLNLDTLSMGRIIVLTKDNKARPVYDAVFKELLAIETKK